MNAGGTEHASPNAEVGHKLEEKGGSRGRFFQTDPRTWAAICTRHSIAAAASYLVIAQGTFGNSGLSCWSAKAIEQYTGLHCTRAKAAIGELLDAGFLRLHEKSTRHRPRYEIVPFHKIEERDRELRLEKLNGYQKSRLDALRDDVPVCIGSGKRADELCREYRKLVASGLAEEREFEDFYSTRPSEHAPEFIWLPNALVTGAHDEPSPVRLLRGRGDLIALRLLVDLYQAQNLSADGGIRKVLWRLTTRKEIARRGRHVIWGFKPDSTLYHRWVAGITTHLKALPRRKDAAGNEVQQSASWDAFRTLIELGLLYEVLHLVESDDPESEIIHPYGVTADAEPMERELATAAQHAAERLLGPGMTVLALTSHLAPVWDSFPRVQMVGIYRLRYRPATRLTSDWYRRLGQRHQEWLATYDGICRPSAERPALKLSFTFQSELHLSK